MGQGGEAGGRHQSKVASADSSVILQCLSSLWVTAMALGPGHMISQIRISAIPLGTWKVFGSVPELPRLGGH